MEKSMTPGALTLRFENEVAYVDDSSLVLGVAGGGPGWAYDRVLFQPRTISEFSYTTVGAEPYDRPLDGTALEDWQCGVVKDINFHELRAWTYKDVVYWTPVYTVGRYAKYWDRRELYSDFSTSTQVDPTNVTGDGLQAVTLDTNALYDTVSARIYVRTDQGERLTYREYLFVENFTGELSGGERLDVGEVGSWNVANFSARHFEITLDENGDLVFNQSPTFWVGAAHSPLDLDVIEATWELIATGDTFGRALHLKYFPLVLGSVDLVAVAPNGALSQYNYVSSLAESYIGDEDFVVDHDLGIVQIGGYEPQFLALGQGIDDTVTTIPILGSEAEFASWPESGIAVIGTEEVRYYRKEYRSLCDCVRGWNSTTPASHSQYDVVECLSVGTDIDDDWRLFARYQVSPRVEYEVTQHELRTANGSWLNLHPAQHVDSSKVVQIDSGERNIASIELVADAPQITENVYGPVYYGTDVTRITAIAYDSYGRRVDDVEITIALDGPPGTLNGGPSYTGVTSSNGEVSCLYNSPYDYEDIELPVSWVSVSGGDTELDVPGLPTNIAKDDIWIFQVAKHDPIEGGTGKEADIDSWYPAVSPGIRGELAYFEVEMEWSEDFGPGSTLVVYGNDSVIRRYGIVSAVPSSQSPETMLFGVDSVDDPILGAGAHAWLLGPEDIEFDDLEDGVRVVLYRWYTSGWKHPLTGEPASVAAPVAAPLHPDTVGDETLRLVGVELPVGDIDDPRNNLAGYVVIAPERVTIRASGVDPYSGRLIESNRITLNLRLANPVMGVDITGALPVPSGWRLPTETYNIGSALGAPNFITINPAASGINRFTLTGAV
jgi:hypothetical protein